MTYEIATKNIGEWLWLVNVVIKDDAGYAVLEGETTVFCETEQEAHDYAEEVFLPDLRNNFPRKIGTLVFPWEVSVEIAGDLV